MGVCRLFHARAFDHVDHDENNVDFVSDLAVGV